jgi:hypothetical protein
VIEELTDFLANARQRGYAVVGAVPVRREADGSCSLLFGQDDWQYHDNFFGGDPFAGREVVHRADRPVWCMVYYGACATGLDANDVFRWLREALRMGGTGTLRGPDSHEGAGWVYGCRTDGDIERFTGTERITVSGELVYRADFAGGWVDLTDAL